MIYISARRVPTYNMRDLVESPSEAIAGLLDLLPRHAHRDWTKLPRDSKEGRSEGEPTHGRRCCYLLGTEVVVCNSPGDTRPTVIQLSSAVTGVGLRIGNPLARPTRPRYTPSLDLSNSCAKVGTQRQASLPASPEYSTRSCPSQTRVYDELDHRLRIINIHLKFSIRYSSKRRSNPSCHQRDPVYSS